MRITVTIPDEFAAQVQARGVEPESFGQSLIDEAVRTASAATACAGRKLNVDEFIRGMAANSEKISPLPDGAFTRESFYQDHD